MLQENTYLPRTRNIKCVKCVKGVNGVNVTFFAFRWDLQHLRQQQQQQHLIQKDKNKSDKGKTTIDDDAFTSLYPNAENGEFVIF